VADTESVAEFVVRAAFTLTGRGTCVGGYVTSGGFRTGDRLEWVDGSDNFVSRCVGIELINERPAQTPPTIGLVIAEVSKDQFQAGMVIKAFR
jgi:translation elongation factor EF-Tu-like GTPase